MKKFIMFMFVVLMCSSVSAKIDNTVTGVYYKKDVQIGKKSLNKKSVKTIIREILDRHKVEKFKIPNTIPIPLYDSLDYDKMKNLA